MISDRDFDYVTDRLLAPAVAASEATQRLNDCDQGAHGDLAARLVVAHQKFLDECRAVRGVLADRYQAERRR